MKNNLTKVKKKGKEISLVNYANDISNLVVSIFDALTVLEDCRAELERTKLACHKQSLTIDKEILRINTKYTELNKIIENEINDIEHKKQIKLYIKHKMIESLEQLERQADCFFDEIINNNDYSNLEEWFEIMNKIKSLRCKI